MSNIVETRLIETLAASLQPRAAFVAMRNAVPVLLGLMAAAFLAVWLGMGLRTAWPVTAFAKIGFFAGLAMLLWAQVVSNATPAESRTGAAWIAYGITLSSLAVLGLHQQPMALDDVFAFAGFPQCVGFITLTGSIVWGVLRWALRDARPALNARVYGAATGSASGMMVTALYATRCPTDTAMYLAVAYVGPILLLALIGGAFPHRAWRW